MKRTIEEYKELEQLAYYVYREDKYKKPATWDSINVYSNEKNGFYAEAFRNKKGEVFLVFRGSDMEKGFKEAKKDIITDAELALHINPNQIEDAYKAYQDLSSRYGIGKVSLSGYSLGASLSTILSNELGLEAVNFAPYGVGRYFVKNKDDNIINFGHYKDPIFRDSLGYQFGETYIVADNNDSSIYSSREFPNVNNMPELNYHFPNQMGDISNAIKYEGDAYNDSALLNGYVYHENFDDNIFDSRNRVFYKGEVVPFWELDDAGQDNYLDQEMEKNG